MTYQTRFDYTLRCDKCIKKVVGTSCIELAVEEVVTGWLGWTITDHVIYCPECTKEYSNARIVDQLLEAVERENNKIMIQYADRAAMMVVTRKQADALQQRYFDRDLVIYRDDSMVLFGIPLRVDDKLTNEYTHKFVIDLRERDQ